MQCIRRYYDTKNVFPHLVNCGKYSMTILSLVALSLYRIDGTHFNLALFIAFAAINAVYCCMSEPTWRGIPTDSRTYYHMGRRTTC